MTKKKRSSSSSRWLSRQHKDTYTAKAKAMGYRSRAAFKLLELNEKDGIIKPGNLIVDLGAAPGGWSQVATEILKGDGQVIALDLLPIEPLVGVDFIQGDFSEDNVLEELISAVDGRPCDVVISDMAPNFTGTPSVDAPRAVYLSEVALDFVNRCLKPGGTFVVKLFHGEGFDDYVKLLRSQFGTLVMRKPKASRTESKEVYAVAKNFKGCK